MRTNFTSLRESLAQLVSDMNDTMQQIMENANEKRAQLLAIYGELFDAAADLTEFGTIVGETAMALADIEEASLECAGVVADVVSGVEDIPTCDFEKFVGWCDTCGGCIVDGEEYTEAAAGWLTCENCLHANDPVDEVDEDETDEVESDEETVVLAETVTENA